MASGSVKKPVDKGRKASAANARAKPMKPQDKSDLIVDSDEEAGNSTLNTTTATRSVSVSSDSSSVSSDGDSDSDDNSSVISAAGSKPSSEESSVVSSDDDDDDDHNDDGKPSNGTAPGASVQSIEAARSRDKTTGSSGPRRAIHYQPPEGYKFVPIRDTPPMLAQSELDGKQVWHITAPANVPISQITRVSLDAIQNKGVVLSHAGTSYILTEDPNASAHLLLPSNQASGYLTAGVPFSKTLRLQQHVHIQHLSSSQANPATGTEAAAHIDQASVSRIKAQPRGLKMRYKPPGFGAGRPGTIGSESEDGGDADANAPVAPVARHDGPTRSKQDKLKKRKAEAQETQAQVSPHRSKSARKHGSSVGLDELEKQREKAARKEERRLQRAAKEERRKSKMAQ